MKGSVRNMNNVQNEMKAVTKEKGGTANEKIGFFHSMRFKLLLFVVEIQAASVCCYRTGSNDGSQLYGTCTRVPEDFTFKYRELFNRQRSSDRKWT